MQNLCRDLNLRYFGSVHNEGDHTRVTPCEERLLELSESERRAWQRPLQRQKSVQDPG